jgi:hypothetical protein
MTVHNFQPSFLEQNQVLPLLQPKQVESALSSCVLAPEDLR